jgi:hypothetical protein
MGIYWWSGVYYGSLISSRAIAVEDAPIDRSEPRAAE